MERASAGNVLMLRLDHDEDILESISKAVAPEKSTLMLVLGIGMIHDFEIGYFDRGRYIRKVLLRN
jgi:predicted DNA-binding protein with PD1-like motif